MAFKRSYAAAVFGLGFVALALSLVAQSQETYKARFSPLPADQKTRAELAGTGSVTAVLAGAKLTINGSFDGLRTAATVVRLHNGVAAGVRGPAISDLTASKATSGSITGSVDLTPPQIQNLRKGGLYVQLHSERSPEGNLWGWFLK
jgi:hypothetical protein